MSKNKKKGGNTVTAQPTQAEKLKNLGNDAFKNANYEKAKDLYTQAIQIDPNPVYYSNRSAAWFELDEFDESLNDAQKSVDIDANFWKGYLRKGLALREMDRLEEAIENLQKAKSIEDNEVIQKNLTSVLEEKQKDFVLPKDDPEAVRTDTLLTWLQEGGTSFPKLKIKHYSSNYRGVHATRKIKSKEQIVFIPLSHLITLEMAKSIGVGKKLVDSGLDLLSPKHSFLSTYLLRERKNPNSFWKPYLDMLPENYNSFPVFFSEDEMKLLEGSPFADQVRDKKSDLRKDYDAICQVAPEFAEYSFHDFCWARMTASSRIFGIVINGEKTDAFVPVADMLNHRRPKQTSWFYSDEKKGFIIESLEDLNRGEQVCDSYGRKCNSRFFLNYGFINLDNDANEVAVRVTFDKDDETIHMKEKMLGETATSKTFRILASMEEENTIEFMNYIRFTEIRDKNTLLELMNIYENSRRNDKNDDGYKPQKTPPLTVDLEIRVLKAVKVICERSLKGYPTTLDEDKKLLENENITYNEKNSIMLRSGEKEILHFMLILVERCLPLLETSLKQIRKVTLSHLYNPYLEYIKKIVIPLVSKKERESNE